MRVVPVFSSPEASRGRRSQAISHKEYPSSCCGDRLNQNIPVGQLRVARQSVFHRPHRPLAQCHPFLVDLPTEGNNWVNALPRHTFGPLHHRLHIDQLGPVPVQCQNAPASLNGIILTIPTVCLSVTSLAANSYGYDDDKSEPTRCAVIGAARGDR